MSDVLKLDEPLKYKGATITELRLVEPTILQLFKAQRHIEITENPEAVWAFQTELVAAVSGLKAEALDDLDAAVLVEAADRLTQLFRAQIDAAPADIEQTEIVIDPPLHVGQAEYSVIGVRSAKTGEMRKARGHLRVTQGEAQQTAYRMSLLSAVADLPMSVVHELPASLVVRAVAVIELFTSNGRRTGNS